MSLFYDKLFEAECARAAEITDKTEKKPSLLLHACCAPCSSAVLERLMQYFDVTILFYNPNIFPRAEYERRRDELKRFVPSFMANTERNNASEYCPVCIIEIPYDEREFYRAAAGLEHEAERGARCARCFELRLLKTALYAAENGFDYFTATLSISPHKNADTVNTAGKTAEMAAAPTAVTPEGAPKYLYADFKKKNGYARSLEISAEYSLYRQTYCGCEFSLRKPTK